MTKLLHKARFNSIVLMAGLIMPTAVIAGQLYRFLDQQGILTLSKTLPAEIAQQGYDILDDRTLQLLEIVPPALEAKALEQHYTRQAELNNQLVRQRQQAIYDRNLLSLYPSEADLVAAKDKDLQYLNNKLNHLQNIRPDLVTRLTAVQQEAADKELAGKPLSQNLQQRLAVADQQLINNQSLADTLQEEITVLSQQYELEQLRLRHLLQQRP